MRAKRGVKTIKKLLFFSASLSIIALGAVWMMLFNEPISDTMTKAPPAKKQTLAYEQALAAKQQEEAEASSAKSQLKSKDAAKTKDASKSGQRPRPAPHRPSRRPGNRSPTCRKALTKRSLRHSNCPG